MAIKDEISWFKQNFAAELAPALAGTPLSIDLVCAIAFQESGELWSRMRKRLPRAEVLRLSVGDTLDTPNRSAFPKDKDALVAVPRGDEMFALAHRLLGEMAEATQIEVYQDLAARPHKFVHGYGIFQYDLQFFRKDPLFFLEQRWKNLDEVIEKLMDELTGAVDRLGFNGKKELSDLESAFVAIVYNTGFRNFKADRGLAQGHFDGKNFYGENIDRYIKIAHTIPSTAPAVAAPAMLAASVPRPTNSVVAVAKAEFGRFAGIDEGDEPLRSRIADYYEAGGGSRALDPTKDENAWSAAFVSFCIKQSGATSDQFAFNLSHSVFVRAAIRNADAGRGVFRGRRVGEYAPKLGDLVHHNRSGGSLNFDFAREHSGYPSHSCIVVDFENRNGVRQAVTIGGNEFLASGSGTVGKKFFPLDANGFLDQARIGPKLICIVENLLAAGAAPVASVLGPHVVRVRTDLKLRGGPGPTFPIIRALPDGTPLDVLQFVDNPTGRWALVDVEGDGLKDGFVFATFIEPVAV
jgi:hypothetical protein